MSDRSQVYTCEGHLLCGVELDGVDCEEDNKDETQCCIKHPIANDINQSVQGKTKIQLHVTQKSAKPQILVILYCFIVIDFNTLAQTSR